MKREEVTAEMARAWIEMYGEREFTGEELRAWLNIFRHMSEAAKFCDTNRAWSHDLRTVLVAANQGDADAIVCAEAWQAELVKNRLKGYA